MENLRASFGWLIIALALTLGGCATSGSVTTAKAGDPELVAKLAEVVIRTDVQVTKAGADVPTAITRANQLAFFDSKTREMIRVPDGRGGSIDVIRGWSFDSTDTLLMRTLPSLLTTLTGGVVQGEYGKSMQRQGARLNAQCARDGTCPGGPSTIVNAVSGSTSLVDRLTVQTLMSLSSGCADGNCPPPTPSAPPNPPAGD